MIDLVDNILEHSQMRLFIERVEEQFCLIFNTERANLLLINPFEKDMYRILLDPITNEEFIQTFKFGQGLAGYVAYSGHTLFIQNIEEDTRFDPKIDDHNGVNGKTNSSRYSEKCKASALNSCLLHQ